MKDRNWIDRMVGYIAPQSALKRAQARMALQVLAHYDGASTGRRTENWKRVSGDANAVNGPALNVLRDRARDLARNHPYAKRAVRTIRKSIVGYGIRPRPRAAGSRALKRANELWDSWANTTECDSDGRHTIYGLQAMAAQAIAEGGEVLIRKRTRRVSDGLTVPLQLQVLEGDYLDTAKTMSLPDGGRIIQGVEYDPIGRRRAYWIFPEHPGQAGNLTFTSVVSKPVPASEITHVFFTERPGQVRGITWLAPVVVRLKDLDDYADAQLLRQKIAACFTAFVSDAAGSIGGLGEKKTDDPLVETLEPGMINYLKPGQSVQFVAPPTTGDYSPFTNAILRAASVGIGLTYEQLTGDYSQVNYSSARMGRNEFSAELDDWRFNMFIPQFCDPSWSWFTEAALIAGALTERPRADWTPPPLLMVDPEKEIRADLAAVRSGFKTLSAVIRERGDDPDEHIAEIEADAKRLDDAGLVLDSDPRNTSAQGQIQADPVDPAAPADPSQGGANQ